jgi:hypothetical protein
VDAADDGQGNFRVVVVPGMDATDEPWPAPLYLRQGTRANGWVLLREVSVGFEIWRQMNGFPPALEKPPALRGDGNGPPASSVYGGYGSEPVKGGGKAE